MELPPGYSWRAPSRDDVPGITECMIATDVDAYGSPDTDENEILDDWAYDGFDPATDAWVIDRPGGGVAGYSAVFKKEPGRVLEAYGGVHPNDQGVGLGAALVELAESRAVDYMLEVGSTEIRLQHHVIGVDVAGAKLFSARGYEIIRHSWRMTIDLNRDLLDFPCPEGIEVRKFRPGEEQAVHALEQHAFRDHWGFTPERYEVWLARTVSSANFDPDLWLLATNDRDLVGESLSYIRPGEGYVEAVSVLPSWRGRGIAAYLLSRSFQLLKERGLSVAALHVDALNPTGATRLYERVGMKVDRRYPLYAKTIARPG